jgi:hypothetical protein
MPGAIGDAGVAHPVLVNGESNVLDDDVAVVGWSLHWHALV